MSSYCRSCDHHFSKLANVSSSRFVSRVRFCFSLLRSRLLEAQTLNNAWSPIEVAQRWITLYPPRVNRQRGWTNQDRHRARSLAEIFACNRHIAIMENSACPGCVPAGTENGGIPTDSVGFCNDYSRNNGGFTPHALCSFFGHSVNSPVHRLQQKWSQ